MSQLLTRIIRQRSAVPLGRTLMAAVASSASSSKFAADELVLSTTQTRTLQPIRSFHSTPLNLKASAFPEVEEEEVKASDVSFHW